MKTSLIKYIKKQLNRLKMIRRGSIFSNINPIDITNKGFTIIELMLATVIFTFVLLILSFGIIQISNAYYRGVTLTTTQNTARNILADISQNIQFGGSQIGGTTNYSGTPGTTQAFCIGSRAYFYQLGFELVSSNPNPALYQAQDGLVVVDNYLTCPSSISTVGVDLGRGTLPTGGQELLQPKMRLSKLTIVQDSAGLYDIDVQVTYGDNDLLNNPTGVNGSGGVTNCMGGTAQRFCATSELQTAVAQRVN